MHTSTVHHCYTVCCAYCAAVSLSCIYTRVLTALQIISFTIASSTPTVASKLHNQCECNPTGPVHLILQHLWGTKLNVIDGLDLSYNAPKVSYVWHPGKYLQAVCSKVHERQWSSAQWWSVQGVTNCVPNDCGSRAMNAMDRDVGPPHWAVHVAQQSRTFEQYHGYPLPKYESQTKGCAQESTYCRSQQSLMASEYRVASAPTLPDEHKGF
jgi:hypothetical protein